MILINFAVVDFEALILLHKARGKQLKSDFFDVFDFSDFFDFPLDFSNLKPTDFKRRKSKKSEKSKKNQKN